MPIPLTINGVTYQYPKLGDENWGQDATNWAVGITQLVNSIDTLINNTISAGLYELADGSAATPSLRFQNSLTTGIYRAGSNILSFSAAGVQAGQISATGRLQWIDGLAASPSISFISDTDTGIYRIGANQLGLATNGVLGLSIDASQNVNIAGSLTVSGSFNVVDLTAIGNTVIGDANTDTLNIVAELISNITPDVTNSFDLGSSSKIWKDAYLNRSLLSDGLVGSPSLSFTADTDTGVYRSAANVFRLVSGGVSQLQVNSTGIAVDNGSIELNGYFVDRMASATLLNNTTGDVFTFPVASNKNFIVDFSLTRGSSKETGQIIMSSDGTLVQVSGNASTVVDCGVSFSGDINSGNVRLRYTTTNTGSSATMKYVVKRWND